MAASCPIRTRSDRGDFLFNTIDHLFAEVWSRPGMSIRDRRLVLIGIIAAQAEVETLEIQLRAALHKGELTTDDVREIVVLLPYYIGYPRSSRILLMSQRPPGGDRKGGAASHAPLIVMRRCPSADTPNPASPHRGSAADGREQGSTLILRHCEERQRRGNPCHRLGDTGLPRCARNDGQ